MWFELIIATMPLFAGITASSLSFGPERVLWGAGAFALLSIIPAISIADHTERFSWRYVETFEQFVSVAFRSVAVRSFAEGVQSAALYIVWPVALFLILGQTYFLVGLVMTISLLLVLLGRDWYRLAKRKVGMLGTPSQCCSHSFRFS